MRKTICGLLVVVLWGVFYVPVFAQGEPEGRSVTFFDNKVTLQGLKKVSYVAVEIHGIKAEQASLLKDLLQTSIELKLRQNGIPVIIGEWLETPGFPQLVASVLLYEAKATGSSEEFIFYSESISLRLSQAVQLKRAPHIASSFGEVFLSESSASNALLADGSFHRTLTSCVWFLVPSCATAPVSLLSSEVRCLRPLIFIEIKSPRETTKRIPRTHQSCGTARTFWTIASSTVSTADPATYLRPSLRISLPNSHSACGRSSRRCSLIRTSVRYTPCLGLSSILLPLFEHRQLL